MTKASRIIAVVLVTVGAALAFRWLLNPHDFFDLKIYMSAMHWWREGNPLYDFVQPDRVQGKLYFTYPPLAALSLLPFSFLPLGVTETLFTVGTIAAVAVTTSWLMKSLKTPSIWYPVALATPLILLIEPIRETLSFGQINLLLIVLILADLLIGAPKGAKWTGVGVGLATALKLFPGIFIVYFLVTKQWRAAVTAMTTAAAATLLAAAIAPQASWEFWTSALWDTARVGRTDYTGNQSLMGLLSRLIAPGEPSRAVWLLLAVVVTVFGLWRAKQAADAGKRVAALAYTGLVAGLISPITWPHHIYWFAPAMIALVVVALAEPRPAVRWTILGLTAGAYAICAYGVVSKQDWGIAAVPTDTLGLFLGRNMFVLLSLALLVAPLAGTRKTSLS